jgi:4-hydroxybenzoate polyprenyltransferase
MTMFRNSSAVARASQHLENIKFSHSIFALPFAVSGALLAERELDATRMVPGVRTLAWIVAAVVAARTCAMAVNRLADAAIDARNPRTAGRPIPSGKLTTGAVATLAAAAGAAFIFFAFMLAPLCGWLSPAVLAVLLGYSFTKRFTSMAHLFLGLALALAPCGAWLAVTGRFDSNVTIPVALGLGVLFWVAGFDCIYSCQDVEFDRRSGLHSIPARFGVAKALQASTLFHAVAVVCFVAAGRLASLGWIYYITVALIALLLAVEHAIVRPNDLSRVNAAFFTINGWVSVAFLAGLGADLYFRA